SLSVVSKTRDSAGLHSFAGDNPKKKRLWTGEAIRPHQGPPARGAGAPIRWVPHRDVMCQTRTRNARGAMAPALLDRPVSPHEHGSGEGDAHGAGRLLIENRLELGGPLDGQITGAGALEDLVDEDRGAAVHLGEVDTVGHEASSLRELGEAYGGQAPSGR